jgi:hypothetical protein
MCRDVQMIENRAVFDKANLGESRRSFRLGSGCGFRTAGRTIERARSMKSQACVYPLWWSSVLWRISHAV